MTAEPAPQEATREPEWADLPEAQRKAARTLTAMACPWIGTCREPAETVLT